MAEITPGSPDIPAEEKREQRKAADAAYRERNREAIRARNAAWKSANREKVNEQQRRRRAANPEQTRDYGRASYARHREARRAKSTEWERRNPERRRELRRQSTRRHAPANRARVKAWQQANPERVKAQKARYRAARRNAVLEKERFTRLEIAERDGWRCHICRKKVTRKTWSLDHLIPLAYGGPHTRQNVAIAHQVCNATRNHRGAAQLLLVG